MYIFVDESGTFTFADKENAWCTIAAYVLPESKRRQLDRLVSDLRLGMVAVKKSNSALFLRESLSSS